MRGLHGAVSFAVAAATAFVLGSCTGGAEATRQSKLSTQVYSVRDILWGTTPAATLHGDPSALAMRVREATDPAYWTASGASICAEDSGYLTVTADATMQETVGRLLEELRTHAAPPPGR